MTWQEELRKLDSALAEGELAANEYRKRRDEILAAASSAQPPSPVIGPPTGPRPVITPEAVAETDNAEVTQIVNVDAGEAEQTQIIDAGTASGAPDEKTKETAAGDVERTQVVTAEAPPQPQQAPPPQPVWAAQLPDPNAQAGPFPRPPQPMAGPTVTPMDAQDLFTSNKPPRGGKKPWLIGLVVLVVLALAGGAVWFFAFRGGDDPRAADDNDTQQTTTAQEEPLPEPVDITKIELPGEAGPNSGEMDIQRAGELNVIAPAEATLLAGAGAKQLVYNGTSDGQFHFMLYAYKSADAKAAEELTAGIIDVQKQLGFKPTEVEGVPGTVDVSTVTNAEAAGIRGVYTYGDTTIQMFVLQIPAGDADEMRVQFQRAMQAVTDAAPPAK
ncbi:SHOCT domain-containing protein [Actinophytocola sp. KF-1]